MPAPAIHFCINNEICDDVHYLDKIQELFPDAEIVPSDCLDHCSLCERAPYVLIDGEIVKGKNIGDFFRELEKRSKG